MAVFTSCTFEVFREFSGSSRRPGSLRDDLPDAVIDLKVFDILGNIVEASEQAERILESRQCAHPEAGCHAQPGLLPQLDHDPLFERLNGYRHGGLSARHGIGPAANLNNDPVALTQRLRAHISLIEFGQQGLCNIDWFDVAVINFSFHELDYNRFAILLDKNITK